LATPTKNTGALESSGIRVAFSLDTLLLWIVLLHFPHSPHPCGLAKQKKVSRLRVREPDQKKRRGSDIQITKYINEQWRVTSVK
jgi:hypothetical protein